MIINKISNINSTYFSRQNTNFVFNKPLQNDVFVKTQSFGAKQKEETDDKSFEEFEKWAQETNFLDDIKEIVDKTGKILGSGFEGVTYEIPGNDRWVIKKYKRGDFVQIHNDKPVITELNDISPKLNIGQEIARVEIPVGERFSCLYYILKRQEGRSFGVPYAYSDSIDNSNIKMHLKSLSKLAKFPQSAFDKCIKDISYVSSQGYKLDCCNPYNFMLDDKTQSINFVDVNERIEQGQNQYGEVLYSLLDGQFGTMFSLEKGNNKNEEDLSSQYSDEITLKFIRAMRNNNAKFTNGTYFTKLLESNLLNNILNADTVKEKTDELRRMGLY